jgi:hypothetical protein
VFGRILAARYRRVQQQHATARRIGMQWVGETEKYHHLRLQEYRLTPADLAVPRP